MAERTKYEVYRREGSERVFVRSFTSRAKAIAFAADQVTLHEVSRGKLYEGSGGIIFINGKPSAPARATHAED